jgi:hypothetical protein
MMNMMTDRYRQIRGSITEEEEMRVTMIAKYATITPREVKVTGVVIAVCKGIRVNEIVIRANYTARI